MKQATIVNERTRSGNGGGAARAPLRVLIVEDDTLVGMGLEAQVTQLGHDLIGRATTPAEARQMFGQHHPDLVLMDIRLDHGDGIELARELMAVRRVAMIIVSAYSEPELIRRAGDAGVYGYLIKPVMREALSAQIEVAVRRFEETARLESERQALAETLEARKLAERAKGILMKRLNLGEADAHKRLQQESQKRRMSLAEISKRIIDSEELLGGR